MRDGPLDDAAASCHAMSSATACSSSAAAALASSSLASANSHKTLTATVYYQQQPQQHQSQQQQQQSQYQQQQQTTQLPVQLQLHPQLQPGGDGKQSVYTPPPVQAGFPLIFFASFPSQMAQRTTAGIARETKSCIPKKWAYKTCCYDRYPIIVAWKYSVNCYPYQTAPQYLKFVSFLGNIQYLLRENIQLMVIHILSV